MTKQLELSQSIKYRSHKKLAENRDYQVRLGASLRALRKAAAMSQVDTAKLINVDQSAYSRIESGDQGITLWQLIKFSETFNVPIDSMARGKVNLWKVAQDFGQNPAFPARYACHQH